MIIKQEEKENVLRFQLVKEASIVSPCVVLTCFYHPHTNYSFIIVAARQRHGERREGRVGVGGCPPPSSWVWQPSPPLFLFSIATLTLTLILRSFAPPFPSPSPSLALNPVVPPFSFSLPLPTISPPTPRYPFLYNSLILRLILEFVSIASLHVGVQI